MTLPIARELASSGIRVVTVAPGSWRRRCSWACLITSAKPWARWCLSRSAWGSRGSSPCWCAIVENPLINSTTIRLDGAIRMQPK